MTILSLKRKKFVLEILCGKTVKLSLDVFLISFVHASLASLVKWFQILLSYVSRRIIKAHCFCYESIPRKGRKVFTIP